MSKLLTADHILERALSGDASWVEAASRILAAQIVASALSDLADTLAVRLDTMGRDFARGLVDAADTISTKG